MVTPVASSPYDSDSSLDPDTLLPKFLELQTKLYELRPELFDQPKKGKNLVVSRPMLPRRIPKLRDSSVNLQALRMTCCLTAMRPSTGGGRSLMT